MFQPLNISNDCFNHSILVMILKFIRGGYVKDLSEY